MLDTGCIRADSAAEFGRAHADGRALPAAGLHLGAPPALGRVSASACPGPGGDLVLAHLLTATTPRPFEIAGFLLSMTGVLLILRLGRHTQSLG